MAILLFCSLFIFLLLGVPVAFSMGLSSMLAMMDNGISLQVAVQKIFSSMNSFPLMAIPFFVFAGNLMESSGISQRLVNFANALVGRFTGGLGIVTVLTAMFFAAISGSSAATTAAIGSILIPAMVKRNYPIQFATSVQAVSGELGVIIPPSIPMIIFALSAGSAVSIGDMFIAGIGPGILIAGSLMLVIFLLSKKNGYGKTNNVELAEKEMAVTIDSLDNPPKLVAFKRAILPLLMPFIILGGIYGGIFTPTEAAAVAVGYAFILGAFIYRTLNLKTIMQSLKDSVIGTSVIMFIIANAGLFGWVLTAERIPNMVADWFIHISDKPFVFLILVNILLLIVGMFLETGASIVIMAPLLTPVAILFGINPVHFGIIMIVNLAIGMLTPPVGVNLFVACQIAGIRIDQIIKSLLPFYLILIIDLILISYLPGISLWLLK